MSTKLEKPQQEPVFLLLLQADLALPCFCRPLDIVAAAAAATTTTQWLLQENTSPNIPQPEVASTDVT